MFKMYTHCCCWFLVAFFSIIFYCSPMKMPLYWNIITVPSKMKHILFSPALASWHDIFNFITKARKRLVIVFSFVYIFYDLSLSTMLTKLLRFKLNQITRKRSGRTRLTMLLRWKIFTRPTRKLWLNQAYHASEVGDFNQAYQETLVKPGLPNFWGGNFKPDLTENLGYTRFTRLLR